MQPSRYFEDDDLDALWVGGRMMQKTGTRKMAPAERPQDDRLRKDRRDRARAGKEFNRSVND